jgi:hypothetical protein
MNHEMWQWKIEYIFIKLLIPLLFLITNIICVANMIYMNSIEENITQDQHPYLFFLE